MKGEPKAEKKTFIGILQLQSYEEFRVRSTKIKSNAPGGAWQISQIATKKVIGVYEIDF
jgi:hypothetical protein